MAVTSAMKRGGYGQLVYFDTFWGLGVMYSLIDGEKEAVNYRLFTDLKNLIKKTRLILYIDVGAR